MVLTWQPIFPYHWVATVMTIILVSMTLMSLLTGHWKTTARKRRYHLVVMAFVVGGSAALTVALWNPIQQTELRQQDYHLSIVLDVSESVLGPDTAQLATIKESVADFVQAGVRNLPENITLDSAASIITFGDGAKTTDSTLEELATDILKLDGIQLARSSATDIGQGLTTAIDAIGRSGNRGEILLVTDGHQTTPGALDAALSANRQGFAITVLPLSAGEPPVLISALNMTRQAHAQLPVTLRGIIENHTTSNETVAFDIWQNPTLVTDNGLFGASQQAQVQNTIPANSYGSFAQSLIFEGVGLQFADVILHNADDVTVHQRRVFTHVIRPVQVLVYGDANWSAAISPNIEVTLQTDTSTLDTIDLNLYDTVVIGGLPAGEFNPEGLTRLAATVENNGLGLMIINGDHRGADEQAESVLRSYKTTPIDPLLPVETDPRPFTPEPPPRHVVLLIDTSGSMSGWPLAKAKEIAIYLIEELLRPEDILDVVTFTTGSLRIVESQPMTPNNKQAAISAINRLTSGGGTDPREALRQLENRRFENCGMIFISDGAFAGGITARPDCRATAFGIGATNLNAISEIADPFVVNQGFNPAGIEIPYFEPEEREKFFEFGGYIPLSLAVIGSEDLPVPNLRLEGTAVSYVREDAALIALRPKFMDPVLAYQTTGFGTVGVMTTRFPDSWTTIPDGQQAIEAWLLRTVGYYDRERYDFDIIDDGETMTIMIEVRNQAGTLPEVSALTATLSTIDEAPLPLRVETLNAATFRIVQTIERTEQARQADLIIEESGVDALPRPQKIPILIPAAATDVNAGQTGENAGIGTNTLLLQHITVTSGGIYAPDIGYTFFQSNAAVRDVRHWWRVWMITGATLYFAAIALQRFLR